VQTNEVIVPANIKAAGSLIFTNLPDNTAGVAGKAVDMALRLRQFSKEGLKPVVILEPTDSSGPVSFKAYRSGAYDGLLAAYFQGIRAQGITDRQMGEWVYFPEANLPEWGPVDAADFASNVSRSVNLQKDFFPAS